MRATQLIFQLCMSVVLSFGVYQFYFWCQRNPRTQPRQLRLPIDDAIPFVPRWVWIYSCLYYQVIVYLNFVTESPRHFLHLAMSYIVLLLFQMAFFVIFPVATPAERVAGAQLRPGPLGAFSRVRANLRRAFQQFSQHAYIGGNADGPASRAAARWLGLFFPRPDRTELSVHETALPPRPSRRRGPRLARLSALPPVLLNAPTTRRLNFALYHGAGDRPTLTASERAAPMSIPIAQILL